MANNFPASLEKHFLVSSVLTSTGNYTGDLMPFQLGLFDSKFYKSVSTVPTSMILAVGSAHTGQKPVKGKLGNFANVNSINKSYKTPVIDSRTTNIIDIQHVKASISNLNQVSYLGYDGVNYCGALKFECDKSYYIQVDIYGQQVQALFGKDLEEIMTIQTDCCADCSTGCTTYDMQEKYVDALINQINVENLYLNRFITAHKVIKRCPVPTAPTTVGYTQYCISICDEGNAMALARAQSPYTTKIVRQSYVGSISTYVSDYQLTSASAPAAYVAQETILQNCSTCPTGGTAVPGNQIYKVTIENTGVGINAAAWLSEVQTLYSSASAADRTDYKYGSSTYTVTFPAAYTGPGAPVAGSTYMLIGASDAYCTMPPVTYNWAACGTSYKVSRTLRTLIQNPACNAGQTLIDLQAYYVNDTSIIANSVIVAASPTSDSCKTLYELQQYSNLMVDGCDWTADATFTNVRAWNGFIWNVDVCAGWTLNSNGCPIPPTPTTTDFVAGIRFDVTYDQQLPDGCAYSIYDELSKEPIFVDVTFGEFNNKTRACQRLAVPYKVTQHYKKENLRGHSVIKDLILTGYYEGEVYHDPQMAENAYKLNVAEGLNYGIDKNKFYNYVKITFDSTAHNTIHHAQSRRWTYYFYVEQNNVLTEQKLLSLINKIADKANLPLLV